MDSIFKKCRHPHVAFFYFASAVCLCVAVKNPIYIAASFACALLMNILLRNRSGLKNFALLIPFFVILSCFNPLVSRWGDTVLFYLGGDKSLPVTLEAFCYGLNNAFMLITIVLWFLAFNRVLTAEKLTFIFAPLFPGISIMLVMILRMIPFYRRRFRDISDGRRGLGLERGTSLSHRIREKMHVLAAVTSSTLEDGRTTAGSMENRGWGKAKRTSFIHYSFGAGDFLLLVIGILLLAVSVLSIVKGAGEMNFYPVIDAGSFRGNLWNCAGLGASFTGAFFTAVFCRR